MNITSLFKSAPLLMAASFALGGVTAAHAQEFTFTAPTTSALTVHPGDSINFSGTLHNDTSVDLNGVIIIINPAIYGSRFTFFSPFFNDMAAGETLDFTGTLKISKTTVFSPTFFKLDANGMDDTNTNHDMLSDSFKVTLAPNPVPEASTTASLGLLLVGLGLVVACSRKRRAANG